MLEACWAKGVDSMSGLWPGSGYGSKLGSGPDCAPRYNCTRCVNMWVSCVWSFSEHTLDSVLTSVSHTGATGRTVSSGWVEWGNRAMGAGKDVEGVRCPGMGMRGCVVTDGACQPLAAVSSYDDSNVVTAWPDLLQAIDHFSNDVSAYACFWLRRLWEVVPTQGFAACQARLAKQPQGID